MQNLIAALFLHPAPIPHEHGAAGVSFSTYGVVALTVLMLGALALVISSYRRNDARARAEGSTKS